MLHAKHSIGLLVHGDRSEILAAAPIENLKKASQVEKGVFV
jgi:hypothetical protein